MTDLITLPESQPVSSKKQIEVSQSQESGGLILKCPDCTYWSTNKYYLRQHCELVHTNDRPFKCPFCNYAGKRSHALKEHLVVHSNERPYQCTQCNATFRKKGHLTNHLRMHTEYHQTLECFLCETHPFKSREKLYHHLRTVHHEDIGQQVFCCQMCNYASTNQASLHVHTMAHEFNNNNNNNAKNVVLIKPKLPPSSTIILKCSVCGYETQHRQELESHVLERHIDSTVVKVPVDKMCSATATSNTTIEQRQESKVDDVGINTDNKILNKCHQCGFVSDSYKDLVLHIVTHKDTLEEITHTTRSEERTEAQPSSSTKSEQFAMPTDSELISVKTYPDQSKTYICNICEYECESQRTIKAHTWKHSGHRSLKYPTFQNGPLSVYDDTLLAAKNFIDKDLESVRALFMRQNGDKAFSAAGFDDFKKLAQKPNLQPPTSQQSIDKSDPSKPFPKVIVQRINQPDSSRLSGFGSGSTSPASTGVSSPNVCTATSLLRKLTTSSNDYTLPSVVCTSSLSSSPTHVYTTLKPQTLRLATSKLSSNAASPSTGTATLPLPTMAHGILTPAATPTVAGTGTIASVVNSNAINTIATVTETRASQQSAAELPSIEREDNPLAVMTAVCEAVKKQQAERSSGVWDNQQLDTGKQIWSDSEQSAATLLSLLRQGQPVHHDSDYDADVTGAVEERSIEVASEEVVTSEKLDSINSDTSTVSSTESEHTKPKTSGGICSSLLAVIEAQLKEGQSGTEEDKNGGKPPSKRRKKSPCHKLLQPQTTNAENEVLSPEQYPNVERLEYDNGSMYRCKLCHYISTSSLMKSHHKLHKAKKPGQCSLCNYEAKSKTALQEHMVSHCKTKEYQCKKCNAIFCDKHQLRAHNRIHESGQAYICERCDYVTSTASLFQEHLYLHTDTPELFTCVACLKSYSTLQELQKHMTAVCSEVKRLYYNQRSVATTTCSPIVTVAISSEASQVNNTMPQLGQSLKQGESNSKQVIKPQPGTLSMQTISELQKRAAAAEVASRKSNDSSPSGDKNPKDWIPAQEGTVKCDQCNFLALNVRSLKSHKKRHINDKKYIQHPLEQYKCNLCGYVCHHMPSLKSHMWRHAGEADFSYSFSEVLNSGTTPCDDKGKPLITLRCCHCGFETLNKPELNDHMKLHVVSYM